MRLTFDDQGGWLVTAEDLARHIHVETGYLEEQGALGLIATRLETGSGRDAGRSRVTVIVGEHAWQGIFDRHGVLLTELRWRADRALTAETLKSAYPAEE